MERLSAASDLPMGVRGPRYRPEDHNAGIVHLGLGAFHKAHQAVYTDDALGACGGDWRIVGVSLRSDEARNQLQPQDARYTMLARGADGTDGRVVGSICCSMSLCSDRPDVLNALVDPKTRILTITVTEKGYGFDRRTGGVDLTHPAIASDLLNPHRPVGVVGLVVWALGERQRANTPPFTVLCCDNLPNNGPLVRNLVLDFARRTTPEQAAHIANQVDFPSTMVDRITPASTTATISEASKLVGCEDLAAVETEAFSQWVVEDRFPTGRPHWEAGGAIFVQDVTPYERMKLRMLNGTHSVMAYAGFLAGHKYVRDVMADEKCMRLARRHLEAAAATLTPLSRIDYDVYASVLVDRFSNPHLEHETYQIAMDGTEKLSQRLLEPAVEAMRKGQSLEPFAFAVAAWMRYTSGRTDDGRTYTLRDPKEALIATYTEKCRDAESIVAELTQLPGLFPDTLRENGIWLQILRSKLATMMAKGMVAAIDHEARAS